MKVLLTSSEKRLTMEPLNEEAFHDTKTKCSKWPISRLLTIQVKEDDLESELVPNEAAPRPTGKPYSRRWRERCAHTIR